jgi:glutathione S-transferase
MADTIYGNAFSTCTQRIFVVAHELGVDLKLISIDVMKGEQKQPAFLARQVCFYNFIANMHVCFLL